MKKMATGFMLLAVSPDRVIGFTVAVCWWRPAVSEARTDPKDSLKVLRGKAVEDPALKTF